MAEKHIFHEMQHTSQFDSLFISNDNQSNGNHNVHDHICPVKSFEQSTTFNSVVKTNKFCKDRWLEGKQNIKVYKSILKYYMYSSITVPSEVYECTRYAVLSENVKDNIFL